MNLDEHVSSLENLDARAACLINPASGIANDYLNTFNELLLLIENLPLLLPEMMDDLERWTPVTYRDYFLKSPLPGSATALAVYDKLDPAFRGIFENKVKLLTEIATLSRAAVLSMQRKDTGELDPESVSGPCEVLAARLRTVLSELTDMVNNGLDAPTIRAQASADQIMQLSA